MFDDDQPPGPEDDDPLPPAPGDSEATDRAPGDSDWMRKYTEATRAQGEQFADGEERLRALNPTHWLGPVVEGYTAARDRLADDWRAVSDVHDEVLRRVEGHNSYVHELRHLWAADADNPDARAHSAEVHERAVALLAEQFLRRAEELDAILSARTEHPEPPRDSGPVGLRDEAPATEPRPEPEPEPEPESEPESESAPESEPDSGVDPAPEPESAPAPESGSDEAADEDPPADPGPTLVQEEAALMAAVAEVRHRAMAEVEHAVLGGDLRHWLLWEEEPGA